MRLKVIFFTAIFPILQQLTNSNRLFDMASTTQRASPSPRPQTVTHPESPTDHLQTSLAKASLALSDHSKLTSNAGHSGQFTKTDYPGQVDDHPGTPPSTPCSASSQPSPDHHPCNSISNAKIRSGDGTDDKALDQSNAADKNVLPDAAQKASHGISNVNAFPNADSLVWYRYSIPKDDANPGLKRSPEAVQQTEVNHQGLEARSSCYLATWPHANPDNFPSSSAQTATTSEDPGQNFSGNVKDKNQRLADDIRRLVAEIPRLKTALGGAIPEPSRSVGLYPVTVDQLAAKWQSMPAPHTEPTGTEQDILNNTFDGMMVYLTRWTLTNRY
jgi:hypothetical protein